MKSGTYISPGEEDNHISLPETHSIIKEQGEFKITYMEKIELRPFMHTNQLKGFKDLNRRTKIITLLEKKT